MYARRRRTADEPGGASSKGRPRRANPRAGRWLVHGRRPHGPSRRAVGPRTTRPARETSQGDEEIAPATQAEASAGLAAAHRATTHGCVEAPAAEGRDAHRRFQSRRSAHLSECRSAIGPYGTRDPFEGRPAGARRDAYSITAIHLSGLLAVFPTCSQIGRSEPR